MGSLAWIDAWLQGVKRQNILIEQDQAEHFRLRKAFSKFFHKSNIDQFVERLGAVVQVWDLSLAPPRASEADGAGAPSASGALNLWSVVSESKLLLHMGRLLRSRRSETPLFLPPFRSLLVISSCMHGCRGTSVSSSPVLSLNPLGLTLLQQASPALQAPAVVRTLPQRGVSHNKIFAAL